jgi:hypothetical protein
VDATPCFFQAFAFDIFTKRKIYIGPTSWQRPLPRASFFNEQDLVPLEDRPANVYFRRWVAEFLRPFEIGSVVRSLKQLTRHRMQAKKTLFVIVYVNPACASAASSRERSSRVGMVFKF